MAAVNKKIGWYEIVGLVSLTVLLIADKTGHLGISKMGTIIMLSFLQSIVCAAAIWMSGYLVLRVGDYIVLVIVVFVIQSLFYPSFIYLPLLLGGLWTILNILVYCRYKQLIVKSVECFLAYLVGLIGYILFDVLYDRGLSRIYNQFRENYQMTQLTKALFLTAMTLAILGVIAVLLLLVKLFLHTYISKLDEISGKYQEIAKYSLLVPWILVVLLVAVQRLEYLFYYVKLSEMVRYVTGLLIIMVLGMQLLYIRMLIKTIRLKEHLAKQEMETSSQQEYNSNLAKNIDEVRAIKHDIKNVFLTMGEYVDRSDDEELKQYYQEKIAPFASQELKMNDLYVELQCISDESLRGFFYYKMVQGINQGVDIHLRCAMNTRFSILEKNLTDIIRILGIFIDNAIEEAIQTESRKVIIAADANASGFHFSVKNSVRKEMQMRGVIAGTTTKGLGRGQGLAIVKKITQKYDDVLWNSYFMEDMYVQTIAAEHKGRLA